MEDLRGLSALSQDQFKILQRLLPVDLKPLLFQTPSSTAAEHLALHTYLLRLLHTLRAALPRWLLADLALPAPRLVYGFEATLLFADVTGFTPLTERLSAMGPVGNEHIARILNSFFEPMVAISGTWGGDTLAFGGDALLIAFRGDDHAPRAAAAACAMREAMAAFAQVQVDGLRERFQLQMKIGMASGPLIVASVGTSSRRVALALGQVLQTTDQMADKLEGGIIRLDQHASALVGPFASLSDDPHGEGFLLQGVSAGGQPLNERPALVGEQPGIAQIMSQIAALLPYLPAGVVDTLAAAPHALPGNGEQRTTVSLFAHLSGLNTLADQLGIERAAEVADLADMVFEPLLKVVEERAGSLARIDTYADGQKLLALFGTPKAHEGDAFYAAQTALRLREALADLRESLGERLRAFTGIDPALADQFTIRAGLNVGPVVAALVGSLERYEYTVIGDAVNLAARLMGVAKKERGEILLSPALHAQIGAPELPTRPEKLKGLSRPLQVRSLSALASTPPPRRITDTPLVGRVGVIAQLRTVAEDVLAGEQRVLLMEGEAGVGKSRLARHLLGLVAGRAASISIGPQGRNPPPYALCSELARQLAAVATGQPAPDAAFVEQVSRELALPLDPRPALAFLFQLERDPRRLGGTAEAQARVLAQALRGLLHLASRWQPLALLIEDLQQADARSLAVLEVVVQADWEFERPLLLALTMRRQLADAPESNPRLLQGLRRAFGPAFLTLSLDLLGEAESSTLVSSLLPGLAPATQGEVLRRGGGNPLFLELLCEALRRPGVLRNGPGGWAFSDGNARLEIPNSLRELIDALLDQLPYDVRLVACAAAVIAQADSRFELWLLEQLANGQAAGATSELALDARWRMLIERRVVMPGTADEGGRYAFRHALFQEAAYRLLQASDRRALHARTGELLDGLRRRAAREHEGRIDQIAYHAFEGHDWARALRYSLPAGQRARRAYANTAARRELRRAAALARASKQPHVEAQAREELGALYTLLGQFRLGRLHLQAALRRDAQLSAEPAQIEAQARRRRRLATLGERTGAWVEAEADCRNGLTLATPLGLPNLEVANLYNQLAVILRRRGELDQAEAACEAGLAALPPEPDAWRERVELWLTLATVLNDRGRYDAAIKRLQKGIILAETSGDRSMVAEVSFQLAEAYYRQGDSDHARETWSACLATMIEIGDSVGRIRALNSLGLVSLASGETELAWRSFAACVAFCERMEMPNYQASALLNLGQISLERGQFDEAQSQLISACAIFARLGNVLKTAHCRYLLGDVALQQGDPAIALTEGRLAIALAKEVNSLIFQSCALRVIGEALAAQSHFAEAETYLGRALSLQTEVGDSYDTALIEAACAEVAMRMGKREAGQAHAETALKLAREQHIGMVVTRMERLMNAIRSTS